MSTAPQPTPPPPDAVPPEPRPELDDAPPILGSWRNIYLFVLGSLVLLVALLWALTRVYA